MQNMRGGFRRTGQEVLERHTPHIELARRQLVLIKKKMEMADLDLQQRYRGGRQKENLGGEF